MPISNPQFGVVDNGTYITVSWNGTPLYRITKSNGQFGIEGGFDSDQSL